MTMNIGKRFLQNAEQGRLYIPIESSEIRSDVEAHFEPTTFGKALNVPTSGRGKARFVQQWRMKQV
jgi:hypothetical protein